MEKAQIDKVLMHISCGGTLQDALKDQQISASSWHRMRAADPIIADRYAHARERKVEQYADEIVTIADSDGDPAKVRNQINARTWLMERLIRHVYGNKVDVNVTHVDLGGALIEGRKRAALQPVCDQRQIAKPEPVEYTEVIESKPRDKESVRRPDPDLS